MYQIPLSPYAEVFYYEWKLAQNRTDYNIVFSQEFENEIDIIRLGNAIKRFISENIIFNSHVINYKEKLCWIKNSKIYHVDHLDSTSTNKDILSFIQKTFNLENGPLYRFGVIKKNNKHKLIIVLHHILIDGSSFDYFSDELSNYYNDEYYQNNISIEKQLFSISKLSQSLSINIRTNKKRSKLFWKNKLFDLQPLNLNFLKSITEKENLLTIPERLELSVQELNKISEIRFSFNKQILSKLSQLIKKYNVSPFLYGQCIYAILLHIYTGQDKFCLSYPVAIKEGMDFIYGVQVNINLIPFNFKNIKNILDIINQSKEFIKSLKNNNINHSYLPISDIVSGLNKEILNLSFVQTNFKNKPFIFKGSKAKIDRDTNIDLSNELIFEQEEQNKSINYRVRYRLDKINTFLLNEFIECYKRLFIKILDELITLDDIDQIKNIKSYNFLSKVQHKQLIHIWNNTNQNYPSNKTIQALFEAQVKKTPNNIAAVFEENKLTYKELNERANKLGHYLRGLGVRSETLVVIAVERSIEMIIGILGILKAGGAYVPLDPDYPVERFRVILEDTQAPIIVTDKSICNKLPASFARVVLIDEERHEINQCSLMNLTIYNSSHSLAYVIYTSGTTGSPKGVMIEHKSIVNLAIMQGREFGLTNVKKVKNCLWYASYVFDAHIFEVFTTILHGHIIHIANDEVRHDLELLKKYIQNNDIAIATIPPALLNNRDVLKLELLVVAGDKTEQRILDLYHNKGIKVINAYGPTEITVCSSFNHYNRNGASNIGMPISNTKCYVLDICLNLLPIGAVGELYIGGVGLARGYLNKPEFTAEKFIPNPFQTEKEKQHNKNMRLYKTGDLVRWLPDCHLEYIGRDDFQVKIRGYRIELGEIEKALSSYEGIKKSVVIAKEHNNNTGLLIANKYLAGYYISDIKLDEKEVLRYLSSKLPEYMMPAVLMHIDNLPLTINGKLDRQALPEIGFTSINSYVAPRNQLERRICKIWAEILGLSESEVGIYDDFFKLGGDSILVIRLISKLNEVLNPVVE